MRIFQKNNDNRGVATILVVGVLVVFLIFFLVIAIDFAYIYVVRGQAQNAADAAALAGAAKLTAAMDDGTAAFLQNDAREEAWKFACKNYAAGENVYLVGGLGNDCDSPPADLNDSNAAGGDIVVGNWRVDISGVNCNSPEGWRPAGGGYFCRATGSTGLSINAVKAVPRRMQDHSETGGQVGLIFGRIVNWSFMDIAQVAIAARRPPFLAPMPICLPSCSLTAPIDGQWGYDSLYDANKCAKDPNSPDCGFAPGGMPTGYVPQDANRLCSDTDVTTGPVGQQFFLNPSSDSNIPAFAWTNFDIIDVSVCSSLKCNNNPDAQDVQEYLLGKEPPDICGKSICITNGGLVGPVLNLLKTVLEEQKREYTIDGQTVDGWRVTMPVVLDCAGGSQPCPSDPTGRPYPVNYFANVLITEVISSGSGEKKGIRIVGLNNPKTITYTCREKQGGGYEDITRTRLVTTIGGVTGECPSCELPLPDSPETRARLVR